MSAWGVELEIGEVVFPIDSVEICSVVDSVVVDSNADVGCVEGSDGVVS